MMHFHKPTKGQTAVAIHVLTKIEIKVDKAKHELDWGAAATVKAKAAAWLRSQPLDGRARITIKLSQKSPDVADFVDGGTYISNGKDRLGLEYAAEWVELFPEWGRGR
jgi:hypothetical protein